MKTVPTLRLVLKPDAPAELDELGVADLPAEVRLALTDIAGAAREGLLAMSVAAGMAVMRAMFDAEITAACGLKGKHDPERTAVRHGAGFEGRLPGQGADGVAEPARPVPASGGGGRCGRCSPRRRGRARGGGARRGGGAGR